MDRELGNRFKRIWKRERKQNENWRKKKKIGKCILQHVQTHVECYKSAIQYGNTDGSSKWSTGNTWHRVVSPIDEAISVAVGKWSLSDVAVRGNIRDIDHRDSEPEPQTINRPNVELIAKLPMAECAPLCECVCVSVCRIANLVRNHGRVSRRARFLGKLCMGVTFR